MKLLSQRSIVRALAVAAAALLVFGGVYGLTAIALPDPPLGRAATADPESLPLPRVGADGDGIGPSEDVSFQIYDADTGLPVAKVTIGTYRRTGDTVVELGDVTVGAAVQGGAAVTLESPGGTVRVDPPVAGRERQVDADALAAADRARLDDVTLRWYADARDLVAGRDATFTARVDNVVFDGSRLTLETGETVIDGQVVLGDDVPVTVRGADLDFDGFGLQVAWDADAGRPQLVRVARAGKLTLKNPPPMLPPGLLPGDRRPVASHLDASDSTFAFAREIWDAGAEAPATGVERRSDSRSFRSGVQSDDATTPRDPLPVALVGRSQTSGSVEKSPTLVWLRPTSATNVTGEPFAQAGGVPSGAQPPDAEAVEVTPYRLRMGGPVVATQGDVTLFQAAQVGALLPLRQGSALAPSTTPLEEPAPTPTPQDEPSPQTAPAPSPKPATPKPAPAPALFEPVVVTWPGEIALVAAADGSLSGPDDARLSMAGDEAVPFRATLDGGTVAADRLDYAKAADELVLSGGGAADGVVLTDAAGSVVRGPKLVAHPDAGVATIQGAGDATLTTGDATSTLVWAEACDFAFDETPAGDRALRYVDARGGVAVNAEQLDLTAQTLGLTLDKVAGEQALTAADAAGDVVATLPDADGEPTTLEANRVLVRSPQGQSGPTTLEADGKVVTRRPDGLLSGDKLLASVADTGDGPALQNLRVEGNVALADNQGRLIEGAVATVAGEGEPVVIVGDDSGPAVLNADLPATGNRTAGQATLLTSTIVLDPADESLAVPVPGVLVSAGDDGEQTVSWTGSLAATDRRIDAVGDVVIEGEARENDAEVTVTAGRATVLLDELREPTRIEAGGDVAITALQRGPSGGEPLMTFDLRAAELSGDPVTTAVAVPVPGRMLIRDLRPPTEDEAFGGVAAIGWAGRLDYDPTAETVTLVGDVNAAVEPTDQPAFDLRADSMVARVARDGDATAVRLLGAIATGSVRLDGEGASVEADRAVYDAAAGTATLTATTGGGGVRVFDPDGRPTGQFQSATYNLATGQINRLVDLRAAG